MSASWRKMANHSTPTVAFESAEYERGGQQRANHIRRLVTMHCEMNERNQAACGQIRVVRETKRRESYPREHCGKKEEIMCDNWGKIKTFIAARRHGCGRKRRVCGNCPSRQLRHKRIFARYYNKSTVDKLQHSQATFFPANYMELV